MSAFIIRCVQSTPGVLDDDVPTVVCARLCVTHPHHTSCKAFLRSFQEFLVQFLMALFRVEQIETPCCVLLYIYLKRLQASDMVGDDFRSHN